jgi:cyanuric acid amidohydrolase
VRVGVHKLPMNSPNDVSALVRLTDAGEVNPSEIVAVIGKTEGSGGANDFTRGFATLSYSLALAPRLLRSGSQSLATSRPRKLEP